MRAHFQFLAIYLAVVSASASAAERVPAPNEKLIALRSPFSCRAASRIKFSKLRYDALTLERRVFVDGTYNQCQINKNSASTQRVVYFVNPTPTKDTSRIFYGIIDRSDLEHATTNCKTAGAVGGVALAIAGMASGNPLAEKVGSAIYNYGDVSCDGLQQALKNNNLMILLAPTSIINNAAAGQVISTILPNIPFISDTDKNNLNDVAVAITTVPQVTIERDKVEVKAPGVRIEIKNPLEGVHCCSSPKL